MARVRAPEVRLPHFSVGMGRDERGGPLPGPLFFGLRGWAQAVVVQDFEVTGRRSVSLDDDETRERNTALACGTYEACIGHSMSGHEEQLPRGAAQSDRGWERHTL